MEPKPVYATDANAETAAMSELERTWQTRWRQLGPHDLQEYEYNYVFHSGRKWEMDFAFPEYKVGIELHGGTWTQGRHVRGGGFEADREKMNAALSAGWAVFEFTTGMLEDDPAGCVGQVVKKIDQRRGWYAP